MIHSTTYIVHTRVLSLSKQHIQHQYKTCIFTDLTPWTPSQETSYARKNCIATITNNPYESC